MNKDELKVMLEKAGVPSELYNLSENGRDDERFCLVKEENFWKVYFKERGLKTLDKTFSAETDACLFIYEQLVD